MKKIKVSIREIVLVTLMLAAVLYGVYDYFLASLPTPVGIGGGENTERIDTLITDASKVLEEGDGHSAYAALITGAEADWERDSFYVDTPSTIGASYMPPVAYTGYLEIGGKRMAVIDGVGYEAGDDLETGGYRVKRIGPSAVMIEEKKTGRGITVPLLEE